MSDIVWEDPPEKPATSTYGRAGRFVEQLKAHPGKWAIYSNASRGTGGASGGSYLKLKYGCDVTSRRNDDGTFVVYARWPEDAA